MTAATMSAPAVQATTITQDLATLTREIVHGKAAPEKWQERYEEELKKIKLTGTLLRAQGVDPKEIMTIVDKLIVKAQEGATCDQLLAQLHQEAKEKPSLIKALPFLTLAFIVMTVAMMVFTLVGFFTSIIATPLAGLGVSALALAFVPVIEKLLKQEQQMIEAHPNKYPVKRIINVILYATLWSFIWGIPTGAINGSVVWLTLLPGAIAFLPLLAARIIDQINEY